jgi:hypothetical protein
MTCELIDSAIDFSIIGIRFDDKPIIIGGLAMEYYGIRKHGSDVELLKKYFNQRQNATYKKYLEENVDRYINAKDGTILNGDYY